MNLQEYRQQLQRDSEYLAAEKELKPLLDFSDEVLRLRLEKGWTQAELAQRVGTRQANISRLESGLLNPTVKFLQKVADAFGTDLEIRLQRFPQVEFTKVLEVRVPIIVQEERWEKGSYADPTWAKVHGKSFLVRYKDK